MYYCFTPNNYFSVVYEKSAFAFRYLERYLGTETFDSLMQGFYQEWKFKHPYPEDLAKYFEENSPKPVKWFFDGIAEDAGFMDYKLNYRFKTLIVKNKSDFIAPIPITINDSLKT